MMSRDMYNLETLYRVLTLWEEGINCYGIGCKNCKLNSICKHVDYLKSIIKEMEAKDEKDL